MKRISAIKDIAFLCNRDATNIRRTYFNPNKQKNTFIGEAIDIYTYLRLKKISREDIIFMVDFMNSHKELIKNKI